MRASKRVPNHPMTLISQVAARNCRKRKIDQIKQLEDDVQRIRCKKSELIAEHEKLVAQRGHWTDLVRRLHDHCLKVIVKFGTKKRNLFHKCFFLYRNWGTIRTTGPFSPITTDKSTSFPGVSWTRTTPQR